MLRPWIAEDGALVRLRLVGGRVDAGALRRLARIAEESGDGVLYLTSRANVQIRGLAHTGGRLAPEVAEAVRATGLLPSPSHDRVRNIMVSPLTGLAGGRADLRPVAAELDRLLCADPALAGLPGKFLFCLDDGRGDVSSRRLDAGLVALDASHVQLRAGTGLWGPVVGPDEAPAALTELARRFLGVRGHGPRAAWHVDELPGAGRELLGPGRPRDPRTRAVTPAPPFGCIPQDDGRRAEHLAVPGGALSAKKAAELASRASWITVTPWRSVILPDLE
ncbi:nitrite reductase [Planomonospora corallina]|uniref:nitrite reductase n=1 Tax=Planomonospora corallina TaxID=1806052 RepID=UPI00366DEF74